MTGSKGESNSGDKVKAGSRVPMDNTSKGQSAGARSVISWLLVLALLTSLVAIPGQSGAEAEVPRRAVISILEGSVMVQPSGKATAVPAKKGMELKTGDRIITGKDGKVEIRFDDDSISRISPNSRVDLQELVQDSSGASTTRLNASWGRVWNKVQDVTEKNSRFEVNTPAAVAGVRGTVFLVDAQSTKDTLVRVYDGQVGVTPPVPDSLELPEGMEDTTSIAPLPDGGTATQSEAGGVAAEIMVKPHQQAKMTKDTSQPAAAEQINVLAVDSWEKDNLVEDVPISYVVVETEVKTIQMTNAQQQLEQGRLELVRLAKEMEALRELQQREADQAKKAELQRLEQQVKKELENKRDLVRTMDRTKEELAQEKEKLSQLKSMIETAPPTVSTRELSQQIKPEAKAVREVIKEKEPVQEARQQVISERQQNAQTMRQETVQQATQLQVVQNLQQARETVTVEQVQQMTTGKTQAEFEKALVETSSVLSEQLEEVFKEPTKELVQEDQQQQPKQEPTQQQQSQEQPQQTTTNSSAGTPSSSDYEGDSTVAVSGVTLNQPTATLVPGGTLTLTAAVLPTNATNKGVTWSSSNSSVATVNSSGVVTAINPGQATITVRTIDGNYTASTTVTVMYNLAPGGVTEGDLIITATGSQPVTYGPATGLHTINGNLTIIGDIFSIITLQNLRVMGDLIINTPNATVNVNDSVEVIGNTEIIAVSPNTFNSAGKHMSGIEVKGSATLNLSGLASDAPVKVNTSAGVRLRGTINFIQVVKANANITIDGTINSIQVEANDVRIEKASSGSLTNLLAVPGVTGIETSGDLPDMQIVRMGVIQGRVMDSKGQPVSSAQVFGYENNILFREFPTDVAGRYSFLLPEGTYTISVSATGFVKAIREQVAVTEGQQEDQDFYLTKTYLATQLTSGYRYDISPSWIGNTIVFEGRSFDNDSGSIFKMNEDGTGEEIIINNAHSPRISPDGTKVAYLRNSNLFIASIDGSNEEQITVNSGIDANKLFWQEDLMTGNTYIYFGSYEGIKRVNIQTREIQVIISGQYLHSPSVTADNTQIVYEVNGQIYITSLTNSEQPTLLADGFESDLSPDGKKLVYSENYSNPSDWGLMLMDLDRPQELPLNIGHNMTLTQQHWHFITPTWSSDSQKLAFHSDESNFDGGGYATGEIIGINLTDQGLNGVIEGRIVDENDNPISSNARVILFNDKGKKVALKTNATGYYSIELPAGYYQLIAEGWGAYQYVDGHKNVSIQPGAVTTADLVLVQRQVEIESAFARWNGDNLEVVLDYSANLMADIGSVALDQFSLQDDGDTATPVAIEKIVENSVKLTFNDYNFTVGGIRNITYTQDTNDVLWLKDYTGAGVFSPQTQPVPIPPKAAIPVPLVQITGIENIAISTVYVVARADQAGTMYWSVLPATAAAPDAVALKNGIGAAAFGYSSYPVEGSVGWDEYYYIEGLTGGTDYRIYLMLENEAAVNSLVLASDVFTTAPAGSQELPKMAYDSANNRFLAVYQKQQGDYIYDIFGMLVDPDGTAIGPEFPISSNLSFNKTKPTVAYNSANQTYLVVWSDSRNGGNEGIYGQLVNANGTLLGNNFIIYSDPTKTQSNPAVAYDSNLNRFLVSFDEYDYSSDWQYDIFGQLVDADGTPSGSKFSIISKSWSQYKPLLTFDNVNNLYLLVYLDSNDVYGRFIRPDGTLGTDFPIVTEGYTVNAAVSFDATSSSFLVAWENYGIISGKIISASDSSGNNFFSGDQLTISSDPETYRELPQVASDNSGKFLVTWWDYRYQLVNGYEIPKYDIYGQIVSSDGTLNGTNFRVSLAEANLQSHYATLGANNQGYLVVLENHSTQPFALNFVSLPSTGFTDGQAVAFAVDSLKFANIRGGNDTEHNITNDLLLFETGINDTIISWVSNAPEVISNTGIVTRPGLGQPDQQVTLTATISKGNAYANVTFDLIVRALTDATEYFWDFEAHNGAFMVEGINSSWQWGTPTSGPGNANSGTKVWATNLAGNYYNNEVSRLTSPNIDLSAGAGNKYLLSWSQWLQTETNFDFAMVEVSNDGGQTWSTIYDEISGAVDLSWTRYEIVLPESYAVSNFRVRFNFQSDSTVAIEGWYIDDLSLSKYIAAEVAVTTKENHYTVISNASSLEKEHNIIMAESTPITPAVQTQTFLGNLNNAANASWKVFTSQNEPLNAGDFANNTAKNDSDNLSEGDVLAVLAEDGTTLRIYTIVVVPETLAIGMGNPADATQHEPYAGHTFTAIGGVSPYSFAVTGGALPEGISLNGAVLEGTPTKSGTFNFTVTVTDSAANIASNEFSILVEPLQIPLSATITTSAGGTAGETTLTIANLTGGNALWLNPTANAFGSTPLANSFRDAGTYSIDITTTGNYALGVGIFDVVEVNNNGQIVGFGRVYIAPDDIQIMEQYTISGIISLPEGHVAPAGGFNFALNAWRGTGEGVLTYWIDVTIPAGESWVSYSNTVSAGTGYRVKYFLPSEYLDSPYEQYGLYNGEAGMTTDFEAAYRLDMSSGSVTGVNMTIMLKPEVVTWPINDLAAVAGDTVVNLSWTAVTGATAIQLLQSTISDSSGFEDAGVYIADVETAAIQVAGLENGTQYWFKLVVTGGINAGESNIVTAIPGI